MYRSRSQKSLTSTLAGTYTFSGGTATRTSEAVDVSLYDIFSVQVGYASEVGNPKISVDIESSTDDTNWTLIKRLADYTAQTEKRVVCEHVNKKVRVTITITSGTSIAVTWVNTEAIT